MKENDFNERKSKLHLKLKEGIENKKENDFNEAEINRHINRK